MQKVNEHCEGDGGQVINMLWSVALTVDILQWYLYSFFTMEKLRHVCIAQYFNMVDMHI